jgi:predicted CDP-diglyceride synthetase/phosphatidate cytidylyltransferase
VQKINNKIHIIIKILGLNVSNIYFILLIFEIFYLFININFYLFILRRIAIKFGDAYNSNNFLLASSYIAFFTTSAVIASVSYVGKQPSYLII